MEKFTPSELCADIKIYDYKQKVKYDEKSLVILRNRENDNSRKRVRRHALRSSG